MILYSSIYSNQTTKKEKKEPQNPPVGDPLKNPEDISKIQV